MLKRLSVVLMISTALTAMAHASENGTIREVRLSSGGLAEITTLAKPDEASQVAITVPIEQVDDVLKSLMLADPSGHIAGLSLLGPQVLEDSLKDTNFTAEALTALPALLSAMQGTAVSATSNGKTVKGKVLGVEQRQRPDNTAQFILSVLNEKAGIETLPLDQDTALTIEDADRQAKLVQATEAIARAQNDKSRTVKISVKDANPQGVNLSYVVAAPIWKASYKVVTGEDGKARLQVWAVLENASGSDWKDVKLTLTSAEPVTLKQRLHQIYWKDRHEVPVNTAAGNVPDVDTGELGDRKRMAKMTERAAKPMAENAMASMLASPAPQAAEAADERAYGGSAAGPAAQATERDTSAIFALPETVTLAKGDTLSVPIVDAPIDAQIVSVYRAGSGSTHPTAALMLKNSTGVSLPDGILTAYDSKAGYVGDAQLTSLPNGETRLAGFTTDQKVTITEEQKTNQQLVSIKVVDGVLQSSAKLTNSTTYTISGAMDGDRSIIIEHPILNGWTSTSDAMDGKTASHYRLKAEVGKASEKKVTIVDEQVQSTTFALTDADSDLLLQWSSQTPDTQLAHKLQELADTRRQQASAQQDLDRLQGEMDETGNQQERIRKNLGSVPDNSDLKKRYLRQLAASEDAIADLQKRQTEARELVEQLDADLADAIRSF